MNGLVFADWPMSFRLDDRGRHRRVRAGAGDSDFTDPVAILARASRGRPSGERTPRDYRKLPRRRVGPGSSWSTSGHLLEIGGREIAWCGLFRPVFAYHHGKCLSGHALFAAWRVASTRSSAALKALVTAVRSSPFGIDAHRASIS